MTRSMLCSSSLATATSAATMRRPTSPSRNASVLLTVPGSRFAASAVRAGGSNTSMRNPRSAAALTAASCSAESFAAPLPANISRMRAGIDTSDGRTCSRISAA